MHAQSLSTTTGLSAISQTTFNLAAVARDHLILVWRRCNSFLQSGLQRRGFRTSTRAVCAFSRYGIVPRGCPTIGSPMCGSPCLRDSVAPFHPGLRLFHKEIAVLDRNSARRPFWRGEQ